MKGEARNLRPFDMNLAVSVIGHALVGQIACEGLSESVDH